ncbi:hypothetical protein C7212DRAFT_209359, partial [Tuber magnatum]
NLSGKQPLMWEGFIYLKQQPQSMVFPLNYHNFLVWGKAKGVEQVLWERGLWQHFPFLLECSKWNDKSTCNLTMIEECCTRVVLRAERDIYEQKKYLQEELKGAGQEVIFYPKFHCELNFIERFWCTAKYYA